LSTNFAARAIYDPSFNFFESASSRSTWIYVAANETDGDNRRRTWQLLDSDRLGILVMVGETEAKPPRRVYQKGEDRQKHVGRQPEPEIRFEKGDPKFYVGLCPNNIREREKEALLNEAIAGGNGDRELNFPKRLHVVHNGAIYRAETTDWGKSYHAYPYRGKIGRALLQKLTEMADRKMCREAFDAWVEEHIELHGK
jgi:hypothetical protein